MVGALDFRFKGRGFSLLSAIVLLISLDKKRYSTFSLHPAALQAATVLVAMASGKK